VTSYWNHDWNTAEWDAEDNVIVDKTIAATAEFVPEVKNRVEFANLTSVQRHVYLLPTRHL
jgi:hypothetical protein